jgi:FkbM family methyltransferase
MTSTRFYYALRRIHQKLRTRSRLGVVARWIREWASRRPRDVLITNLDGDLRFKCALHHHIGSMIFWHDSYSGNQLALLDRFLRPEMVFVDVGANVGEQTVFAAKRLTRGRVIAFEPTSSVYDSLMENIALNGFGNVTVVKAGLGERPGELPIYTAVTRRADGTVNEGVPTLYRTAERGTFVENVPILRFDDFAAQQGLTRLDVMKIDVEGAEMTVLKGAAESIRRHRPLIIVEVHEGTSRAAGYSPQALLDYVRQLGYRFEGLLSDGSTRPFTESELAGFRDVICFPLH